MGRPTKLTPEVQAAICEAVSDGVPFEFAALCGGVDDSTFRRWMVKGEEGHEPYRAFRAAIKRAEADGMRANLAIIRKAAPRNWQAAAWLLERRYPGLFGRRVVEQRITVDDLRRRAVDAGLDPDEVVREAETLLGLVSSTDS